MHTTLIDIKSLKTLEDYMVMLVTSMLTLQTLHNFQVRAIEIGILPEDMMERANTIMWDINRLIKHYNIQAANAMELLPEDFKADKIIEKMQEKELVKARAMIRKPRKKT